MPRKAKAQSVEIRVVVSFNDIRKGDTGVVTRAWAEQMLATGFIEIVREVSDGQIESGSKVTPAGDGEGGQAEAEGVLAGDAVAG
jgi:hypothetical protein